MSMATNYRVLINPNFIKAEVGKFEKNPDTGIREIPIYYLFPTNVLKSPFHNDLDKDFKSPFQPVSWQESLPTTIETYRPNHHRNYLKIRVGNITKSSDGYLVQYESCCSEWTQAGIKIIWMEQVHLTGHGVIVSKHRAGNPSYFCSSLAEAKEKAKITQWDDRFYWEYAHIMTFRFSPEGNIQQFWKALSVWDGVDGCAVISVDVNRREVVVGNPPPPTDYYHGSAQWYIGPTAPMGREAVLMPINTNHKFKLEK